MSDELHFKLASGRVMFLEEPLTAEELDELCKPENMAILEGIADEIATRCKVPLSTDSEEGKAMLKKHGIK